MLLNEIKQIFETDREALGGALSGLRINTELGGGSDDKGGDVDDSLKALVERCIVAPDYSQPSKAEIDDFMSPEKKDKTLESLGNLAGTLRRIEGAVTKAIVDLSDKIKNVTGDSKVNVSQFVQNTITNLDQKSSTVAERHRPATIKTLQSKRETLVRMLMKLANAENYGRDSVDEITRYVSSKEFLDETGKEKMTGVNHLHDLIEQFYAVIKKLQENTKALIATMTAAAPAPKA